MSRKKIQKHDEMSQIVHWTLFLACGITFCLKTLETASAASYSVINAQPYIAQYSWLLGGL